MPTLTDPDQQYDTPELSGEEVDSRFDSMMGEEFPDGAGDAPDVSPSGGGKSKGKTGGKGAKDSKGGAAGAGGKAKDAGKGGIKPNFNKEDAALKAAEKVPGAGIAAKKFNELDKNKGSLEKGVDKAAGKATEAAVDATGVGAPAAKLAGKVVEKVGTKRILIATAVIILTPVVLTMLYVMIIYQFIKNPLKAIWDGNPVITAVKALIINDHAPVHKLAYEIEAKNFKDFPGSGAVAAPAGDVPAEGTLAWKYAQIDWEKSKYQTVDQPTDCRVSTKPVINTITGTERSVIDKIYFQNDPTSELSEETKAICISKVYPIFNTMMRSKFLRTGINKEIGLRYLYAEQDENGDAPTLESFASPSGSPSPSAETSPVAKTHWGVGLAYLKRTLIDDPLRNLGKSITALAAPTDEKKDPAEELKKKLRNKTLSRVWKADKEGVDPDGAQTPGATTAGGSGNGYGGTPAPTGTPGDTIGTGKISEFGGPGDYQSGMACVPGGSKELYEQHVFFAAMRDHSLCKQWVDIEYNGKHVQAQILDWGPAASTGRLIDVSPEVMQALGADTDKTVTVKRFNTTSGMGPNHSIPANFAVKTPTATAPKNLLAAKIDSGMHPVPSEKDTYERLKTNYDTTKGKYGQLDLNQCKANSTAECQTGMMGYYNASLAVIKKYENTYADKFTGSSSTKGQYYDKLANWPACDAAGNCTVNDARLATTEAAGNYANELLGLEAARLGISADEGDAQSSTPAQASPAPESPKPPATTIADLAKTCDKDFDKNSFGQKDSSPALYSIAKVNNDLLCGTDPQNIFLDKDIANKMRELGKNKSSSKEMADILCTYSLYLLESYKITPLDRLKKTQKDRISSMISAGWSHVTYADTQVKRPLLLEEIQTDFYKMSNFASAATYSKTYYGNTNGIAPQAETQTGSALGMDMLGVHPEYPAQKAVRQLAGNCSDYLGNDGTGEKKQSGEKIGQINEFYPQIRDQLQALPYYQSEEFKNLKEGDDTTVGLDDVLLGFAKVGTNVGDAGSEDGPQNFNRMYAGVQAYMYAYNLAMGGNLVSADRMAESNIKIEAATREYNRRRGLAYRIFNLDNPRSLANRLGAAAIASPKQTIKNMAGVFADLFNPLRNAVSEGGSLSYFVSGHNNSAIASNDFSYDYLKLEPSIIPDAVLKTDPLENAKYIENLKSSADGDKKVHIDVWYVPGGEGKETDPNKGDHTIKEWFGIWDGCFTKFVPGELALDDDALRECQPLFGVNADQDTSEGGKLALDYKTYHYNNMLADAMMYLSDPAKVDQALYASSDNGSASGSADCSSAQGNQKILCEALKYDPLGYQQLPYGHVAPEKWHQNCPTIDPNNEKCKLDCSGLISLAVYDAFGVSDLLTSGAFASSPNWKKIDFSEVKPGDMLQKDGHVALIETHEGTGMSARIFQASTSSGPLENQINHKDITMPAQFTSALRYIGQGSTP